MMKLSKNLPRTASGHIKALRAQEILTQSENLIAEFAYGRMNPTEHADIFKVVKYICLPIYLRRIPQLTQEIGNSAKTTIINVIRDFKPAEKVEDVRTGLTVSGNDHASVEVHSETE